MIKLLLIFLGAIFILTISGKLLLDSSDITILIGDYRLDIAQGFFIISLITISAFIIILITILLQIQYRRKIFLLSKINHNFDKSLEQITDYIIYNAVADYSNAAKSAHRIAKLLGKHPLATLITLKNHQNLGKNISSDLKNLLDNPKTKLFALQGLALYAKNDNNIELSVKYLEEACAYKPNTANNSIYLIDNYIEIEYWQKAISKIKSGLKKNLLKKSDYIEKLAISYLNLGKNNNDSDAIVKAKSFSPNHPEIKVEYANYLLQEGKNLTLSRYIKKSWAESSDKRLVKTWVKLHSNKAIKKQLVLLYKLIQINPHSEAAIIAYVNISETHGVELNNAKTLLKKVLQHSNNKELYELALVFFHKHQEDPIDVDFYEDLIRQKKYYDFDAGYFCSKCKKRNEKWQAHCAECKDFNTILHLQNSYSFSDIS